MPVQYYNKSNVASTDRGSTVRSSYFKAVNKRVYTNQDNLDNDEDRETGNCTLSGEILRNSSITKRRTISSLRNFEDVSISFFSCHHVATASLFSGP
jgi:hypothetical protein